MIILPYNKASQSAKLLAQELGVRRIRHKGKPVRINRTILNWGCSEIPNRVYNPRGLQIINPPFSIRLAANKLEALKRLDGYVPIPDYTIVQQEALEWLPEAFVVCRTILNGHSGKGIVLSTNIDEMVPAPLYTKYIKKDQEYRVHVMGGEVFFIQRKARKLDVPDEEVNWQIRNHQNGFIYANQDVEIPDEYKEIAVEAVNRLNLDFGAVDIISKKNGDPFVLEVNTAPGLTGTTLEKYCEQIRNIYM